MHGREKIFLALTLVPIAVAPALAGPNNGTVVNGNVTIQGQGTNAVTINQSSQNAIINWQTFNIGKGETVQILMPNASSTELDRVNGNFGPSQINGGLSSNGRVFLINPQGILFGQGAQVNVGSLLATTHDISNADFMAGRYNFNIPGNPSASIVNQGTITAQTGGFAALVAPGVRNSGTITAWLGRVGLASANSFALDLYGDHLIQLNVNDSIAAQVIDVSTGKPLKSLVSNEGTLRASGGRVELSAVAARQVVDSVINNSGVIEANSIGTQNGMIVLSAATGSSKPAGAPAQTIKIAGKLSAAGEDPGTTGGSITITGESIALNGARIDASGANGGGAVVIRGEGGGGNGSTTNDSSANTGSANGGSGSSGSGNSGTNLGAGQNTGLTTGQTASSAPHGDSNAGNVTIDVATVIDASAIGSGNGGKVTVWSDGATAFYGTILARGGAQGGDGGFVETSGQTLTFTGMVNTSAPNGKTGTWLLDPTDLIIDATAAGRIQSALDGNNVTLQTFASGPPSGPPGSTGNTNSSGNGDIIVNAAISWNSRNTLTLDAYNAIIFNASISVKGAGGLVLTAANDPLAPAASLISFANGASVQFTGTPGAGQSLTINGQGYTLLYSMTDVQSINSNDKSLSGHYALANSLDASGVTNWTPIGTNGGGVVNSGNGFTGSFQGLGNTISNFTINLPSSSFVGLFGYVGASGEIQNVGLPGASISGLSIVGALVGYNNGVVSQTYATDSVKGSENAAGLIGENFGSVIHSYANSAVAAPLSSSVDIEGLAGLIGANGGTVNDVHSTGTVTAFGNSGTLGGLIGFNSGGSVSNAYSTAQVTGGSNSVFVGGLIGLNNATVTNSYATGPVSGSSNVGGLIGWNTGAVTQSYATGPVTGDSGSFNIGGLIGTNFQGSVDNSYSTSTVSGISAVGGLVGWNFMGTVTNAHAIGSVNGLDGGNSGLFGIVGGLVGTNDGIIAQSYATGPVTGTGNNAGFFGAAGGLVGLNFGTVSQSHATGTVTVDAFWTAGGLVGINGNGGLPGASISNSYASGPVSSSGIDVTLGGLVGENLPGALISNSQALGNVTATANLQSNNGTNCILLSDCQFVSVGGFVGENYGTINGTAWATRPGTCAASSSFSCANGNVSVGSQGQGGGFAGFNQGFINFAFAKGNVNGAPGLPSNSDKFDNTTLVGGFIGDNEGTISNSFATGNVGGAGTAYLNVGGFAGSNEGLITNSLASGAVLAGDFSQAGGFVGSNSPNDFITSCPLCFIGDGVNSSATISNSQALGNVTAGASSVAGGFASTSGDSQGSGGSFNKVTAFGAVTAGHDSIVGGLVGVVGNNTTLSNSLAQNTLVSSTGPNSIIGGVVGINVGIISNTKSTAPVSGTSNSYIGGIAGINVGALNNVSTDPAITGNGDHNFIGGIAGLNAGLINDSTAQVTITGDPTSYVGGLVGLNGSYTNASIAIPGSSFPNGIITNSNANGSGFSGAVGGTQPTYTPPPPAVLAGCTDPICVLLLSGTLQPPNNPITVPPDATVPTQQINQIFQFPNSTQNTTPPPILTSVDVNAATSGGAGTGTGGGGGAGVGNGNNNNGNGGLANGKQGGNGAPPGVRLIDMPHMPLPPGSGLPPLNETRFLSDRLALQFDATLSLQQIEELIRRYGLIIEAQQTIGILGRPIYTVRIGNGQSLRDVIQALGGTGKVAPQPVYTYGLTQDGTANQGAANTDEVGDPAQYAIKKLQLAAAHRISKGENVIIAVIDSAIDADQPDFAGRVIDRYDAGCGAAAPDAHGTGMTGAIASHVQLLGVAPSAKIIAICAFGGSGGSPEATSVKIIRGLDYAVQHGAKIVNMSFAGPYDPALAQALQVAREKGVLIIAAAGNAGAKSPPLYPGADPNVMAITATDENDRLFAGANQGKYVALAAPGVNILVPAPNGGVQMTTGTSVATANVSGVAALLLAEKPGRTPEDIRGILVSTAKHLGTKGVNPQFGAGLVDPVRALQEVSPVAGGKSAAAAPAARVD